MEGLKWSALFMGLFMIMDSSCSLYDTRSVWDLITLGVSPSLLFEAGDDCCGKTPDVIS